HVGPSYFGSQKTPGIIVATSLLHTAGQQTPANRLQNGVGCGLAYHGDQPPPFLYQAVQELRRQRALTHSADAMQEHPGVLLAAQGAQEHTLLASAPDERTHPAHRHARVQAGSGAVRQALEWRRRVVER